ncbi:MAG: flavodoxin reductase [Flaviaesturariibacter sp.]|nr:flavodoxin reductase [Flaviaesturariibacter sp.]
METTARIISIEQLTHDVRQIRCEKPAGYSFEPGQATELSINRDRWREEKRPFTFTSHADDPWLEFVIKIFPSHGGVTNELGNARAGEELLFGEPWGTIEYRGPGYFIAGGAGITPFIAILRHLRNEGALAGNRLLFSNKTERDIILQQELTDMLGDDAVYTVTGEPGSRFNRGMIDEAFLRREVADFSRPFYVCGPPPMVSALEATLLRLGASADKVVFER